jgi:streptomycin 6-kinase
MPSPFLLPDYFRKTTLNLFPDTGQGWLERLPALISELEDRWGFQVGQPFELSFNYVASAVRSDGSEVVFKAGHPHPELTSEMTALEHYQGRGIVRMFEHDAEQGVMLLERLHPGIPLAEMEDDEQATRIAAGVMRELWLPAPPDPDERLCTAVRWARGLGRLRKTFAGGTGPFPAQLVDQAEHFYIGLLASSGPQMLLHGDLHHWNILSATRTPWLALDPKGLIGEAEYEVGAWMRNRWSENASKTDLQRQADRRLAIFSEMLGFDRQRMLAWCMAQAVLSAWWSYEDAHQVAASMLLFAEALSDMIG